MKFKLCSILVQVLALGLIAGAGGCAHVKNQNAAYYHESSKAVDAVRLFALLNLKELSTADLRTLAETEPKIDHASFARVNFRWPRVCTVVASPPPCQPQFVFDNRPAR